MAKTTLFPVFCLLSVLALGACSQSHIKPAQTQLQVREFQTRTFQHARMLTVMKAMINVLQDEGFLVRNADKDLGFISASKEVDIESSSEAFLARIFAGAAARYKKNSVIECSVNVSEFGKDTRVRAIFQTKVMDNFGSPLSITQVEDAAYYQEFFAKVDKSIFIEKQAI